MKKLLLTTLLATSLTVFTTGCEDKSKETQPSASTPVVQDEHATQTFIEKMSKGRLSVVETFQGPGNLQGAVVQPQGGGQAMIMYVDNAAQFAVYGTIINANGDNITEQDKSKYITPMLAKKIGEGLPLTTQFKEGNDSAPYKMIVLADPNCSACHAFYNIAKPAIDNGQLQVSWILVYFVQKDSEAKAAAILTAKDSAAAMAENEAKFDMSTEEGGIKALETIPEDIQKNLAKNMEFMQNAGINSTPTLIFYTPKGELTYINGSPSNIDDFLKQNNPQIVAPVAAQ